MLQSSGRSKDHPLTEVSAGRGKAGVQGLVFLGTRDAEKVTRLLTVPSFSRPEAFKDSQESCCLPGTNNRPGEFASDVTSTSHNGLGKE